MLMIKMTHDRRGAGKQPVEVEKKKEGGQSEAVP